MQPLVIVCIPYYNCIRYIRRSVLSILHQDHRNLLVAVINDADFESPPWPVLADITDGRLLRFDLSSNRGPYFATQVLLESMQAPYLLIQDADDWSHPERISQLLAKLIESNADFSFSSTHAFFQEEEEEAVYLQTLWKDGVLESPDERMRWRIPHWGLFRVEALKRIGGYYGGARMGYDSFLMNLILLSGCTSFVETPLYHYYIRKGSLTTDSSTGHHSDSRRRVKQELESLYKKIYESYRQWNAGSRGSPALFDQIESLVKNNIGEEDKGLLKKEIKRFKQIVH